MMEEGSGKKTNDTERMTVTNYQLIDALVVGIIDTVNVENRLIYSKKDDPYR